METFFSTHLLNFKMFVCENCKTQVSMPPLSNFACYINWDFPFCFDYKLHSFKKYTIHNKTGC